jgi:hypothetical protein
MNGRMTRHETSILIMSTLALTRTTFNKCNTPHTPSCIFCVRFWPPVLHLYAACSHTPASTPQEEQNKGYGAEARSADACSLSAVARLFYGRTLLLDQLDQQRCGRHRTSDAFLQVCFNSCQPRTCQRRMHRCTTHRRTQVTTTTTTTTTGIGRC